MGRSRRGRARVGRGRARRGDGGGRRPVERGSPVAARRRAVHASRSPGATRSPSRTCGSARCGSPPASPTWSSPLAQSTGGPEAAAAGCDGLRLFTVAKATSLQPRDDVTGQWSACDASTAPAFSAVAFYFGQDLHRALGVKIGLVHSSWGGTPAEAWTSREALAAEPSLRPMVADFDAALNDPAAQKAFAARLEAWEAANYHQDVSNEGFPKGWAGPETDTAGWKRMDLPQQWEKAGLAIDGAVWFRRALEIPAEWAGKDLRLTLGAIDDFDTTYFAGEEIGRTGKETPGYYAVPRRYTVPGRLVKPGRTVIAVRVFDHYGGGGFSGAAPEMAIGPATGTGASLSLAGPWEYRVERELAPSTPDFATQPRYPSADNPNSPTVLYGAMIAPLTPLAIRGAIWYQGESNAGAAFQYRTLFPAMIRDWRRAWGRGDFPFLFVQLANFMARARGAGRERLGRAARGTDEDAVRPAHRHGGGDRHRRGGRHPPEEQGRRGPTPRALGARRHVRPGDREVRPPLRLLRPRGRRRARALPPRGRAEGGRRGREGLCDRGGRPPVALGRGAHRRRDGRRLLARRGATRGRPLRLGRQPGGDAAQRRGPSRLPLPHRRLADAHRPATRPPTATRSSRASTPTRASCAWGTTSTWSRAASSSSPACRSSPAATWCTGDSWATS